MIQLPGVGGSSLGRKRIVAKEIGSSPDWIIVVGRDVDRSERRQAFVT